MPTTIKVTRTFFHSNETAPMIIFTDKIVSIQKADAGKAYISTVDEVTYRVAESYDEIIHMLNLTL